jgi:uncharacterized protein YndB with AHSA1/START domain
MQAQSVTHSTIIIERIYPAKPERVFAAFSDPVKKRRWFVEGEGFSVIDFAMDFREHGFDRSSFRAGQDTPLKGALLSNETVYMDIVPDRRIVMAYTMAVEDKRFSSSQATFEFLSTQDGTKLLFTEQAAFFEGADGPAMREQGWRQLFDALASELSR